MPIVPYNRSCSLKSHGLYYVNSNDKNKTWNSFCTFADQLKKKIYNFRDIKTSNHSSKSHKFVVHQQFRSKKTVTNIRLQIRVPDLLRKCTPPCPLCGYMISATQRKIQFEGFKFQWAVWSLTPKMGRLTRQESILRAINMESAIIGLISIVLECIWWNCIQAYTPGRQAQLHSQSSSHTMHSCEFLKSSFRKNQNAYLKYACCSALSAVIRSSGFHLKRRESKK